jgi:hypothetical protein
MEGKAVGKSEIKMEERSIDLWSETLTRGHFFYPAHSIPFHYSASVEFQFRIFETFLDIINKARIEHVSHFSSITFCLESFWTKRNCLVKSLHRLLFQKLKMNEILVSWNQVCHDLDGLRNYSFFHLFQN